MCNFAGDPEHADGGAASNDVRRNAPVIRGKPWARSFRRAGWGVADQGLSSMTNFVLSISVAKAVTADAFGGFTLAFTAYALVLNVGNGLIGEPILMRYTDADEDAQHRAATDACGTALALGVLSGIACIAVGLAFTGSQRPAFVALGLMLPGLAVQDTWRKLYFARLHGRLSFVIDLIWAAALLPAVAWLAATDRVGVFSLTLVWGAAGSIAAVAACVAGRTLPNPARTVHWLRAQRDIAPRLVVELLLLSGAHNLAMYVISAFAGLEVAGGIRGAEVVLGPLYVFIIGIRFVALPETVLLLRESAARMRRGLVLLALGLTAVAVAVGTGASLLPRGAGETLLGGTWQGAQRAILPVALFMAASAVSICAVLGMRGLSAVRRSLKAQLHAGTALLLGAALGSITGSSGATA